MPNNFIFSNAQGSKSQIYGANGGALTAVSVDGTGQIKTSVTDVVSVTVTNTPSVNVNNTANVSVVNTPGVSVLNVPSVSVANTPSVNVDNTANVSVVNTPGVSVLNVPSVSVANTPGVSVLNIPSVEIHSVSVTADSIAVATGTGVADILTEDTSQQNEYSFYVSNLSTEATMSLALQIAPVDIETYFVNDNSVVTLAPQAITVLVPMKYLDFTRLSYDTGTFTANFIAYYNAKV